MKVVDKAEVIIVGGGYFGSVIAYSLSKRNINTILLEKDELSCGASGANFGCIQVQDAEPGVSIDLTRESFERWNEFRKELNIDLDFETKDSLIVADSEDDWKHLKQEQLAKRQKGMEIQLLTPNEISKIEPLLNTDPLFGASLHREARINPFKLINGLRYNIYDYGGQIIENTEVEDIIVENNQIKGVKTNQGRYEAEKVILAAGAWTPQLCNKIGIDIPLNYVYAEAFVTEAVPELLNSYLSPATFFNDFQEGQQEDKYNTSFVCTQTANGNFLLGETSYPGNKDHIDRKRLKLPSPNLSNDIYSYVNQLLPALKDIKVIRSWRTASPYTNNCLPCFGDIGPEGLMVAAGFKSAVVMLPVVERMVADLIIRERTSYPLHKFSALYNT